jgi:hypothetical protein
MELRNRFQGIDSASPCSLTSRYDKKGCSTGTPTGNRFLGSLKGLQIRAQLAPLTQLLLSLTEALPVRGRGLREEVHGPQQPAQALQAPHQGGPGAVQGRQAGGPGGAPARLAGPGGQQQQQQQPGPPVSRRRVLLWRHVPARGGVFAITQRSVY